MFIHLTNRSTFERGSNRSPRITNNKSKELLHKVEFSCWNGGVEEGGFVFQLLFLSSKLAKNLKCHIFGERGKVDVSTFVPKS